MPPIISIWLCQLHPRCLLWPFWSHKPQLNQVRIKDAHSSPFWSRRRTILDASNGMRTVLVGCYPEMRDEVRELSREDTLKERIPRVCWTNRSQQDLPDDDSRERKDSRAG